MSIRLFRETKTKAKVQDKNGRKQEIATREPVREKESPALSCSLVQVHRIGYSHHIVYLVYTLSSLAAGDWRLERTRKINVPPLTKVTQPGDDKLLLVQAFIDPPGNLPDQSEVLTGRGKDGGHRY